jgi:hypothetical protein
MMKNKYLLIPEKIEIRVNDKIIKLDITRSKAIEIQ